MNVEAEVNAARPHSNRPGRFLSLPIAQKCANRKFDLYYVKHPKWTTIRMIKCVDRSSPCALRREGCVWFLGSREIVCYSSSFPPCSSSTIWLFPLVLHKSHKTTSRIIYVWEIPLVCSFESVHARDCKRLRETACIEDFNLDSFTRESPTDETRPLNTGNENHVLRNNFYIFNRNCIIGRIVSTIFFTNDQTHCSDIIQIYRIFIECNAKIKEIFVKRPRGVHWKVTNGNR